RKIAFICAREYQDENWIGPKLKEAFGGVYIANEKFTNASASKVVSEGVVDAVAFGVQFIANAELPEGFSAAAPLNDPRPDSLYASGDEGYTDYPFMESVSLNHRSA